MGVVPDAIMRGEPVPALRPVPFHRLFHAPLLGLVPEYVQQGPDEGHDHANDVNTYTN